MKNLKTIKTFMLFTAMGLHCNTSAVEQRRDATNTHRSILKNTQNIKNIQKNVHFGTHQDYVFFFENDRPIKYTWRNSETPSQFPSAKTMLANRKRLNEMRQRRADLQNQDDNFVRANADDNMRARHLRNIIQNYGTNILTSLAIITLIFYCLNNCASSVSQNNN